MIAWINFAVLLAASVMLLFFYLCSARPAGQEKIIGPRAYQVCYDGDSLTRKISMALVDLSGHCPAHRHTGHNIVGHRRA